MTELLEHRGPPVQAPHPDAAVAGPVPATRRERLARLGRFLRRRPGLVASVVFVVLVLVVGGLLAAWAALAMRNWSGRAVDGAVELNVEAK